MIFDPDLRHTLTLLGLAALVGLIANPARTEPNAAAAAIADDPVMANAADRDIAAAVRTELVLARHVPAGRIDVAVARGIVTLRGTVPTLLGKERALRVITHLRGVRGVVDRLEVATTEIPDGHVRTAVENALARDAATELFEIDVAASDGTVTLSGVVDSQAEADIAAQVTRGIVGVRAIDNQLEVRAPARRSDDEIRADVTQRLYWDARIADRHIDVDVDKGVVRLSGRVGSLFERDMVVTRAWVDGAREIDASALAIEPWVRGARRDTAVVPEDAEIAVAVADTLSADPRVARFEPQVQVEQGVVTLRGRVDSVKAARAAGSDAANTFGVVAVENLLEVVPARPLSDRDLDRYVTIALDRDAFVTDQPIGISVDEAVVHLDGAVETRFERNHAEDVAGRMAGVLAVQNDLSVIDPAPLVEYGLFDWDPILYRYNTGPTLVERLPDAEIERNIRRELLWSPYLDSHDIEVSVRDGIAVLSGTVPGPESMRYAIRSAYRGGAIDVDDRLQVGDVAAEEPVARTHSGARR